MQTVNGILWLLLPLNIVLFSFWKLEKRDKEHYRDLLIKTSLDITYEKYKMSDPKWDDDYKGEKNEKK